MSSAPEETGSAGASPSPDADDARKGEAPAEPPTEPDAPREGEAPAEPPPYYGLATLSVGVGVGVSTLVERLD